MDGTSKAQILKMVKQKYNSDIDQTTFNLCESAAATVAKNIGDRKKAITGKNRNETITDALRFHSDLVSRAAKTIADQSGATRANLALEILMAAIAIMILIRLFNYGAPDLGGLEKLVHEVTGF